MKVYLPIKVKEELPDRIKDPKTGEQLRFSEHLHVLSGSNVQGVGYYDFKLKQWWVSDYPEATIDRWLKEIDVLDQVFVASENQWFPVGYFLTSKENGELVLATPVTPIKEIVGIVSDSGTIEHYKPE